MKFPNPFLLAHIAIADAYGMGAEYLRPDEVASILPQCLAFKEYIEHPRYGAGKGRYTDDTEMSIANSLVLLNDWPPTELKFANAYVREFNFGGRRKGYSKGFQALLEEVKSGEELLARLNPNSTKNGAAMRSVPIGVLPFPAEVMRVAGMQARITHDTHEGVFSARAVALMSHYSLYGIGPLWEIGDYCIATLPDEDVVRFGHIFLTRWPGTPVTEKENASVAITTVHAVHDLVSNGLSLMGILRQTLLWGGDTDSVAAIAWGIASPRYLNQGIPGFMVWKLENGSPITGVDRLFNIGNHLMQKFD